MLLKKGTTGVAVSDLQQALDISITGGFDAATEQAVKKYQADKQLVVDGIVGPQTLAHIYQATASTDQSETIYQPQENLIVQRHYLESHQYLAGPTVKDYLFLHHTAGWNNPYNTVDAWGKDNRGQIATEFVLGGRSVRGDDDRFDGELVQAMPQGCYAWHLGKTGSAYMHSHSVAVEICNFGWAKNGKTYVNTPIASDQLVTLDQPFKGYKNWHAYSDKQIEGLQAFIQWIANRDNIDVRAGLVAAIKNHGAKAFDFNPDAYSGEIKGMWTHGNVRKDKFDLFPQTELMDMLVSL